MINHVWESIFSLIKIATHQFSSFILLSSMTNFKLISCRPFHSILLVKIKGKRAFTLNHLLIVNLFIVSFPLLRSFYLFALHVLFAQQRAMEEGERIVTKKVREIHLYAFATGRDCNQYSFTISILK